MIYLSLKAGKTYNDLVYSRLGVKKFHMSESHFRRILKQLTGLSPLQYLQEFRLKTAQQLLEKRAYPTVVQIAFQSEFAQVDYFSTVFLKRFGKRPSSYLMASRV